MGMRSITKYLKLFRIVSYIIEEGGKWLEDSRDEDSPGGEDITIEEYLDLADIVENALVMALGIDVEITIFEPEEEEEDEDE